MSEGICTTIKDFFNLMRRMEYLKGRELNSTKSVPDKKFLVQNSRDKIYDSPQKPFLNKNWLLNLFFLRDFQYETINVMFAILV